MLGRLLCCLGLHRWTPPRGDGYARSVCRRCGDPFVRAGDAVVYPPRCPSCPHERDEHNAFGCRAMFCGCERPWVGGGWP